MKKRSLSTILMLCMVMTLLRTLPPVKVQAAKMTYVSKVEVTLPCIPVVGRTIPKTAVTSDTDITVKKVTWKGDTSTGKFVSGSNYSVMLEFGFKKGANKAFVEKAASMNATINGTKKISKADSVTKTTLKLHYDFGKPAAARKVTNINLRIGEPITGKRPLIRQNWYRTSRTRSARLRGKENCLTENSRQERSIQFILK